MSVRTAVLVFLVISGFGLSGYVYFDKMQLEAYLNSELDSLNSIIDTKDDVILEKNSMIAGLESSARAINTEISSINSTLNRVSARASLLRNLVKNGENYLIMGWSMTSFFKLLILWSILGLGMRGILTVPIKQP